MRGRIRNLGDDFNEELFRAFTGNVVYAQVRRWIGCGSILRFAGDGDTVWGSGFMRSTDAVKGDPGFACVRGPLSLAMCGADCGYGDPGLLMPWVYGVRALPKHKRSGLGIILHYADLQNRPWLEARYPGAVFVDVSANRAGILHRLRTFDRVISSSLHGAIACDSLGVPVAPVRLGDAVLGKGFKFLDYDIGMCRDRFRDFGPGYDEPVFVDAPDIRPRVLDLLDSASFASASALDSARRWLDTWYPA